MGLCLTMRRELLDAHGLLREETELGADDLEFSWRYRRLGYELRVVPGVFVQHVGGAGFASVGSLDARKKVRRSDRWLIRLMRAFHGDNPLASSQEQFGCDIFTEALNRRTAESVALDAPAVEEMPPLVILVPPK